VQDNVFKKTKMHIVMVAKLGTIVLSTSTLDPWIFKGNYKMMFDSIEEIQVGGIFSYDKIQIITKISRTIFINNVCIKSI
jgi:hypothetical protein